MREIMKIKIGLILRANLKEDETNITQSLLNIKRTKFYLKTY